MRKAILILAVIIAVLALMFAFASVAFADNGPHGNFGARDTSATTDACAGCHRAHTGTADPLLRFGGNEYQFCTTCHGSGTQGAYTNVQDGVIGTPGAYYQSAYSTSAQISTTYGLNGGGFENMKMYVPANGTWSAAAAVTSKHRVEGLGGVTGQTVTAWGGGSTGPGLGGTLKCTSCHDPHGSPNYRILRGGYSQGSPDAAASWVPNAGLWPAQVATTAGKQAMVGSNEIAQGAHNYAATINVYYDRGISDFCGACHQNYLLNKASGWGLGSGQTAPAGYVVTSGGPSAARDRHPVASKGYYTGTSQLVTWQAGAGNGFDANASWITPGTANFVSKALRRVTDAVGGTRLNAGIVSDVNSGNYNGTQVTCLTCHYAHGSAAQATGWASNVAPTNDSANLFLDNRGVCQACHQKGTSSY